MRAQQLEAIGSLVRAPRPLRLVERPIPAPAAGELLVKVAACGVCHTELDEIEGRTPPSALPRVLGHQVVGRVEAVGAGVPPARLGERVGIGWIYSACGHCRFCTSGRENLCRDFRATGRDADGGYADYVVAPAAFALPIPAPLLDIQAAPLLCAGAIGYRSLMLTGLVDGEPLGLTGFGASGHLVLQLVRHTHPRSPVFVFARRDDERAFARRLGAMWAGDTEDTPPAPPAAIIDTTPAWTPVVAALGRLDRGGRLVINAIRKEDADKAALAGLDYARDLWLEKEVKSVANVTRRDIAAILALAVEARLEPTVTTFPLEGANDALQSLSRRTAPGAIVLTMSQQKGV